nr:helix-turn-helix domain-containing protein [Chloroflexota bacterium]
MKNSNPFSQLVNKLSDFDRAVREQLEEHVRQARADYKKADRKTRQGIVDGLHKDIGKHDRVLKKICLGREQEQAVFELRRRDDQIPSVDELKNQFATVSEDFYHHFPTDKDELARRLEGGKFFSQGHSFCLARLNTEELITTLSRIACKHREGAQITGEALALAMLVEHPGWSDTRIAKAVGVNRTTLYDWPNFKKAKEALKQGKKKFPRGSKNAETGDIEAW